MTKLNYLFSSLVKRVKKEGMKCPSCESENTEVVSRKYIVTSLNRCSNCNLQFRVPTTSIAENEVFYQKAYKQGFTTEMPSRKALEELKKENFKNTDKDYSTYINLLKSIGVKSGASIFDFGCSWGYGSWQFKQAGYEVKALEISDPRREYAIHELGIDAVKEFKNDLKKYDVFFSAHVLEHVPNPKEIVLKATQVLKEGGLFIAITPNGSQVYKKANQESWNHLWGFVHPNFLDEKFYKTIHPNFEFGSLKNDEFVSNLENYELVAYFKK